MGDSWTPEPLLHIYLSITFYQNQQQQQQHTKCFKVQKLQVIFMWKTKIAFIDRADEDRTEGRYCTVSLIILKRLVLTESTCI